MNSLYFYEENPVLPTWAVVLIVIAAVLFLYFLSGLIFYLLYLRAYPKAQKELDALVPYEEERGKFVLSIVNRLEGHGFRFDPQAKDILLRSESLAGLSSGKRGEYRNIVDFTSVYLAKIHKEDARYGKYITEEEEKKLLSYPRDSEERYKKYNRKAGTVNAMRHMITVRPVLKLFRDKGTDFVLF